LIVEAARRLEVNEPRIGAALAVGRRFGDADEPENRNRRQVEQADEDVQTPQNIRHGEVDKSSGFRD
jgi:hypothetical protein